MYLRSKIYLPYVSLLLMAAFARAGTPASVPTFSKEILPILQTRCQACHRPGEIAPMPLLTYEQTRPWAAAIVQKVKTGKMPPWFADKCCGEFSTDHVLKPEEIATIEAWVAGGSLEGKKKDAPKPVKWTDDWKIDGPSVAVSLPRPFEVPANSKIDDQYIILPVDLAEDKWISAVEIHPSDRSIVHHAVLYARAKESKWLRNVPRLTMYAPGPGLDLSQQPGIEILAVYTSGSPAAIWPEGMGKKLPAGCDLILQIHYASKKVAASDRTSVGINFLKERPEKRVLTLQMQNTIAIPAGAADYHASVAGVMPRDVMLIGMFPQMNLRGSGFEYSIVAPGGKAETLLSVKPYDSLWQQSYPLKTPRLLPKGTRLVWTGMWDNSAANLRNPDPKAEARDEVMTGYFDVAVEVNVDKVTLAASPTP